MNKTTINLDILLPDVPDEKDACVKRIIEEMQRQRGIERACRHCGTQCRSSSFAFIMTCN